MFLHLAIIVFMSSIAYKKYTLQLNEAKKYDSDLY